MFSTWNGTREGKRWFIPGRRILEGEIFPTYNPISMTSLIFLISLLLMMRLKLNKYDCILIIRKGYLIFGPW